MAATIGLGKDESITGVTNTQVRSVSITTDGPQIDCTKRGDTTRQYKTGFKDQTIEVEFLEDPSLTAGGTAVTLTAGHATGTFEIMSVVKNEPLDDVCSWNVTFKRTNAASS